MVYFRVLEVATGKIKMRETSMSQKRPVNTYIAITLETNSGP